MSSPYAEAAPDYLAGGYSPIPVPYGRKEHPPIGFTGYAGADVTAEQVAVWSKTGRRNVALRLPATVLGIDVDDYGDKAGGTTLADAEARLGPLPPTWRSTSRADDPVSGIRLFRVPTGRQWADRVGPDGGNVEIIHHGHRYVVTAPSLHPENREYGWFDPTGLPTKGGPKVDELPDLPDAWVAELDRGDVAERDVKADLGGSEVGAWLGNLPDGEVGPAVEAVLADAEQAFLRSGSRHNIARRHVLRLVRLGEQGHDGVPAALDTLLSMFGSALAGDRSPSGEWERLLSGAVAIVLAQPTPTAAEVFDDLRDELFTATPILTRIRDAAYARLVGSQALLCYVLARVLAELPPSVALPPVVGSRASLNLGIAVVGDSGAGKSALLGVSRELLGLTGAWQEDIERNVGSGEGLVQQFLRWDGSARKHFVITDPRRILTVDEIDSLGATQRRNGATIAPTIRSALTGSTLGQANATAERNRHVPANSYRLVMMLGVQPTRSAALLDDADAGTPQRLVWVEAKDPTLPDEDVPWPGVLDWDLPANLPNDIAYPEHVKAEVRAARRAQVKGEGGDPLAGHKFLTRLKVATALAVLHGDVRITDQWWELAGLVVAMSSAVQAECKRVLADELITSRRNAGRLDGIRAEGAAEYRNERVARIAAAVWRKVAKHATGVKDGNDQKHEPGEGCTTRCISRAVKDYPDRDDLREAAVQHAVEADWITDRDGRWVPGESRPA